MNSSTRTHPRPAGEVSFEGDFAHISFQRHLPHPPEKVWAALTDPAQLKQWFMATTAKIDGRPGGSFETVAGPAQIHARGKILKWDPPRVYEYEWITAPRAELPQGENSLVRWELKPVEGGTLLTLVHSRLTRQTARGFAPGLHVFLDRLTALLDQQALPEWMARFTEVRAGYPGWKEE